MGDIDEYDMLDQQLAAGPAADANGGGDKAKEKDRDREKRHRSDKDRKRSHRDRDGESSKDHRHRSSRSSKHDDDKDRKRRHRSRSREHRSRGREERPSSHRRSSRRSPGALPPPPRREGTPPEVREQREREKELRELDRDTRTVFAYNLNLKADEKDIFEFFSRAGQVEDVRIIMDRNTRRSKGFAYIEMATRDSVMGSLALGGQQLMGQTVMVKSSEAEKNLAWEAAQVQNAQLQTMRQQEGLAGNLPGGPCKLHVRNLHVAMAENDVRDIFASYGLIDNVVIQKDGQGKSQGHGYVTFREAKDATRAISQLDGLEIAGIRIKVEMAAGDLPVFMHPGMPPPEPASLEEGGEGSGMRLTADKRSQLMNRLAGQELPPPPGTGPPPPAEAQTAPTAPPLNPLSYVQGVLGPASPIPTQCLLLKNMFDPAEETEVDWDQEIAADVKEECGKYGPVSHLWVDKASKGYIYAMFGTASGAGVAQKALHGRFFAGKQVLCEFQFESPYRSYFKI